MKDTLFMFLKYFDTVLNYLNRVYYEFVLNHKLKRNVTIQFLVNFLPIVHITPVRLTAKVDESILRVDK